MPLTNEQLGLDPRSEDNDYQGDDEVLTFTEAAEHLTELGNITDEMKARLTFEITFTPRRIDHDIPNFWAVYLDHNRIGCVEDGSYPNPNDKTGWTRLNYEIYSNDEAFKSEAKAKELSSPKVRHIAHCEEYYWQDVTGDPNQPHCDSAYFPSFTTLRELIADYQERKAIEDAKLGDIHISGALELLI